MSNFKFNKIIEALKTTLAVRSDNHYIDGVGGNTSLLYFLISKNIEPVPHIDSANSPMSITEHGNKLLFSIPNSILNKISNKVPSEIIYELRICLNNLFLSSSNKKVSEEEITNPDWLKERTDLTSDIKLLSDCLLETLPLSKRLLEIDKDVDLHVVSFSRERDANVSWEKFRNTIIREHIKEDLPALNKLSNYPSFIRLLVFRKLFGIDLIVRLNLDEFMDFNVTI